MWQDLARRTLADLPDPRNWVTVAGRPFLRAYADDMAAPRRNSSPNSTSSLR